MRMNDKGWMKGALSTREKQIRVPLSQLSLGGTFAPTQKGEGSQ
jgi:hypothetical protein